MRDSTDGAVLDLRDVAVPLGGRDILCDVTWHIRPGEHWAVLGANGSGKTTLLRVATGYLWASRGQVTALGERFGHVDLRQLRRRIGLVSSAIDKMVRRNLPGRQVVLSGAFATAALFDEPTDAQCRRADELLERLGCEHLADQPYATCSLGEQQRLLIARALMPRPALLLLDEPCAGLDPPGREFVLRRIDDLAGGGEDLAVVLVTHHVEEIMPRFTHVLTLKAGRLGSAGPKETILTGEVLSGLYDLPIEIDARHGRYWPRVLEPRTEGG